MNKLRNCGCEYIDFYNKRVRIEKIYCYLVGGIPITGSYREYTELTRLPRIAPDCFKCAHRLACLLRPQISKAFRERKVNHE